jgi:hypothetical protein
VNNNVANTSDAVSTADQNKKISRTYDRVTSAVGLSNERKENNLSERSMVVRAPTAEVNPETKQNTELDSRTPLLENILNIVSLFFWEPV